MSPLRLTFEDGRRCGERPRKTRFLLVVNLGKVGLITHKVPNEISIYLHLTFLSSRLCLAQWST